MRPKPWTVDRSRLSDVSEVIAESRKLGTKNLSEENRVADVETRPVVCFFDGDFYVDISARTSPSGAIVVN